MTQSTEKECAGPIKMQPGDGLHLTMLMAPHGLNFVTGKDREQLLAWGRDVWQAARRAPVVPEEVVREACARMCDARAESLQAAGMLAAANEAFKCAIAIRQHPAYEHHLTAVLAAAPQPPKARQVPELSAERKAMHTAMCANPDASLKGLEARWSDAAP